MRVSRQRRPAVCRHFPIFPHLFELLPDGRRRYVVKYRVKGGRNARQRWFGLGTHGQVTCEQARARALQVLSAVARGEDPQAQLIVERTAPTVAELWARYTKRSICQERRSAPGPGIGRRRALAGCLAGTRGIRRYFHVCSGSHKPSIISPESPASRAGRPYRRQLGRRS